MTHRTVPLDLLVHVRDLIEHSAAEIEGHCAIYPLGEDDHHDVYQLAAELAAQIEKPAKTTVGFFGGRKADLRTMFTAEDFPDNERIPPGCEPDDRNEQQREGQGEPVAWFYYDNDECTWTQVDPAESKRGAVPLYTAPPATPQDSVPAWAMELVEKWRNFKTEYTGCCGETILRTRDLCADELESRALALAQTSAPAV